MVTEIDFLNKNPGRSSNNPHDGAKSDPKLEDAAAASTVPNAAFQLSGGYCNPKGSKYHYGIYL